MLDHMRAQHHVIGLIWPVDGLDVERISAPEDRHFAPCKPAILDNWIIAESDQIQPGKAIGRSDGVDGLADRSVPLERTTGEASRRLTVAAQAPEGSRTEMVIATNVAFRHDIGRTSGFPDGERLQN